MRCLLLTYLGMVLVSPALAQEGKQLPPRQGELAPTEEEMAALIRRLGDRKFAARRAASREVLAIGEPGRGRAGRADAREADGTGPGVGVNSRRAAMPLKNHFIPPLSVTHPWSGFHGAWAMTITQQLNGGVLPTGFYAIPTVELGGPVE